MLAVTSLIVDTKMNRPDPSVEHSAFRVKWLSRGGPTVNGDECGKHNNEKKKCFTESYL